MREESELWQIDKDVLSFVRDNHDCSLRDIKLGCTEMTQHTAEACVRNLVRGGLVIQKEDPIEHDWVYRASTDCPPHPRLSQNAAPLLERSPSATKGDEQ